MAAVRTSGEVSRAYEELAATIRQRILSGELSPGLRLPSEGSIAAQSGVGRSTVREALRILEHAGLVERPSPRTLVVAVRGESEYTFGDLYDALRAVDPELARLAASRVTEIDIERLRQAVAEQRQALDQVVRWSNLDIEFHSLLAELADSGYLVAVRNSLSETLLPVLCRYMRAPAMTEAATRYHELIVDQLEAADPDTAAALMRRHIDDWRSAWEASGVAAADPI